MTGDRFVEIVRALGSDADDPRDAAHEAFHALRSKTPRGRWNREDIHERLIKLCDNMPSKLVAEELDARAIEQLVSKRLGYDCGTIEHWAHITWMETLKNQRINLPGAEWIAECVAKRLRCPFNAIYADRLLRLRQGAREKRRGKR